MTSKPDIASIWAQIRDGETPEPPTRPASQQTAPASAKAKPRPGGCITVLVSVAAIGVIIALTSGSGGSALAPKTFKVTDQAVTSLVQNVINNADSSPGLAGKPTVVCPGRHSCRIFYTVKEPTGISTDLELIEPTRQIWKALFEDPQFRQGAIAVSGPTTTVGGKSQTGPLFILGCDRSAASQINWDNVAGSGLRQLCSYVQQAKGL